MTAPSDSPEAIIRDLVSDGPIYDQMWGQCVLCGEDAEGKAPTDHAPTCEWRRSMEWIETHT